MRIIGMVNPNNPDDMRCNDCIDFMGSGRSVYEGEHLTCTYCGDAWTLGPAAERIEREYRAKGLQHCDHCLSFQPLFDGDMCRLCVAEGEQPEEARKAHHTDTPGPVLVYWPMSQVRRSVSMWEMHLKDVTTYGVAGPLTEEEHAEYLRYVSEGIGDTDGYYAPISREAWKAWAHPCRKVKVADADAYGRMLRSGEATTLYGAGF